MEGGVRLTHLLQRRCGPRAPAAQRPDDGAPRSQRGRRGRRLAALRAGGLPGFVDSNADRFKSGKLVAVSADTLPSELQLLKEGDVAALVGQRPFEMGEKAMDALLALHQGKPVQQIIYTSVDRVTKDNVGEFLK